MDAESCEKSQSYGCRGALGLHALTGGGGVGELKHLEADLHGVVLDTRGQHEMRLPVH